MRQNVKRRARNRRRKEQVKNSVREFNEAIAEGKTTEAATLLKTVYKTLDTTAAKGTVHKNTAARRKSRLAKRLAAAQA